MVEEIQSYGMKPQYQYNYLLNQNKEKIVELLGKGFNFYPSNSWTYALEAGRFYNEKSHVLFFEK